MATNVDNNGNNIQFTDNPNISKGVTGYLMGRMAKNEFSNNFWNEDSGFLKTSIDGLERIEKQYEEIAKSADKLGKVSKKHNEENLTQARLLSKYFNDIKNSREVTDKEAIDAMREYYKLMVKSQEDYLKALREGYKLQEDGDDDHLKAIQEAEKLLNKTKKLQRDNEAYLRNTSKALGQATDNWANSLSDTLGKAGNKLKDITNMFNLQAIANNKYEQSAQSKAAIMSTVNKQFGFTNNSQFNDFKNSLNDNLKEMNKSMDGLFNSQDLKNYMINLDKYGITSTQMAQQQMKNSIIAEKYLGVSAETQTAIFKFMKRTNDPEALTSHNKTVVGILRSQLGVSKEQLDKLSEIAYATVEDLSAIGMSKSAQDAYTRFTIASGGAITSQLNDGGTGAEAIQKLYAEFLKTPVQNLGEWAVLGLTKDLRDKAFNATTPEEQASMFNQFVRNITSSQAFSSNRDIAQTIQEMSPLKNNSAAINALGSLNMSRYNNDIAKELENIKNMTQEEIDKYVQETTKETDVQKLLNRLDTWFNGIDWKYTMNLATAAFGLYLASSGLKAVGSMADLMKMFGKGGGFTNVLSGFLGKGSALSGSLSSVSASTGAIEGQMSLFGTSNSSFFTSLASCIGPVIGGAIIAAGVLTAINTLGNKVLSQGKTSESIKNAVWDNEKREEEGWLSSAWHDYVQGEVGKAATISGAIQSTWGGQIFGNKSQLAKGEWKMVLSRIGKFRDKNEADLYRLAALMLFDAGDLLKYLNNEGVPEKHADLVTRYNQLSPSDKNRVRDAAKYMQEDKVKYITNRDGKKLSYNVIDWGNYHKAGLDYVPKDNYKALLHKGEMVLNEREANLLRDAMNMTNMGGVEAGWYSVDDGRRGGSYPRKITSAYREKRSSGLGYHTGVDFAFPMGTPIGAAQDGKIDQSYFNSSYGNMIREKFNNGKYAIYAHQSKRVAKVGDKVKVGDLLGYSGSTGHSTGPHLHFEVRNSTRYGDDTDPLKFVTQGLFRTGTASLAGSSGVSSENSSSDSSSEAPQITVSSGRFVPKAFSSSGGQGGDVGRIVNSVDGGFDKLINYLNGIREEQQAQREILNAFSQSRPGEY